jgi:CRISPR/Cas system CSM-associated protein Csm3 (group 7 of RAMP superfamily)
MSIYKTLVKATIKQQTAFSIGGAQGDSNDNSTFRNGHGVLTIPATGLAGGFVETLMRIFPDCGGTKESWKQITGKQRNGKNNNKESGLFKSIFSFRNSHPLNPAKIKTEWRQGVGIEAETGTASEHSLFEFEVVPSGTAWSFFLEIDSHRAKEFDFSGFSAEEIALLVISEWQQGFGWIGRNAARGCGWFKLENIEILELPVAENAVLAWPDISKNEEDLFASLKGELSDCVLEGKKRLPEIRDRLNNSIQPEWCYLRASLSFEAGKSEDGYGIDTIQSGGHSWLANYYKKEKLFENFIVPETFKKDNSLKDKFQKELDPDSFFPLTRGLYKDKITFTPFLPGSSVRGSLRSLVGRIERSFSDQEKDNCWGVLDPNDTDSIKERVESLKQQKSIAQQNGKPFRIEELFERLFGISEFAGKLLVRDAVSENPDDFVFLQHEQHAEDEFCCGVYGSGKFNSTVVLNGKFNFDIVLEAKDKKEAEDLYKLILPGLKMAQKGWMPIGGGKLKGAGYVKVRINNVELKIPGREATPFRREEV